MSLDSDSENSVAGSELGEGIFEVERILGRQLVRDKVSFGSLFAG